MKKVILTLFTLTFSLLGMAQEYEIERLKEISTIWGEIYLFHPSIIRADKNVEWEKQFVDFLPKIKDDVSEDEFIKIVNTDLLSALEDPFTVVQRTAISSPENKDFSTADTFDYIRLTENQLSNIGSLACLDSLIVDRNTHKALFVDLRIYKKLKLDKHSNTLFEYFASMLLSNDIALSPSVTREHYGWDEYNDWWFYEQRWKVAGHDKHGSNSGALMPFKSYSQELYQHLPAYNFCDFKPIERPVYFITNNSFLSYYNSLLNSLQMNRVNTYIINDNTGRIYSDNPSLKKYSFNNFEFILNTSFDRTHTDKNLSLGIAPKKYKSPGDTLSQEEKILGIVKIWTIVKYFYAFPDQISVDWNKSLEIYLQLSQNTSSDKEYYTLIEEMMAALNDSHVSTFHPSILDYSALFVAPIKFEWIEEKVIITAVDSSVKIDADIGDEIVSINGLSIDEILKNEGKKISSSNKQGLISTLINPGYFIGPSGSLMKLGIRKDTTTIDVVLPKTTSIFQMLGSDNSREASNLFEDHIGYLNLALLTNPASLEQELKKLEGSNALILDLRSSYPTYDFHQFLRMLCAERNTKLRIDEVPVISANHHHSKQIQTNEYIIDPDTSFSYHNPIAVLIDKTMISRPEDIALCLKAFPNIIFIGEQTQGTDGEMTLIHLPGGGETSFTGQEVKFGNGEVFQRTGIVPDIKVQRTIDGVKKNKDEILGKAIEVLLHYDLAACRFTGMPEMKEIHTTIKF